MAVGVLVGVDDGVSVGTIAIGGMVGGGSGLIGVFGSLMISTTAPIRITVSARNATVIRSYMIVERD